MSTFENNHSPKSSDEKLEIIGASFLDNFLRYQQRNYQGIQAERRYELRDRQIKQMVKNGSNSELLLTLVSAHKGHHPVETYNKMKNMIVQTATGALFKLHELNKAEGTNFTVDDCIDKVLEKASKEEIVEYFIEEQKAMGETDLCPDFMSPNALTDFKNLVSLTEARILIGKEPFENIQNSESKEGKTNLSKQNTKNIESVER